MPPETIRPSFNTPDTREGRYLFLDLDPPYVPGIVLVGGGREVCTAEYRVERSAFPYHAVEFVVGGTWELRHGGGPQTLRPGAVFAYGPHTAYSVAAGRGGGRIKYFLNFAGADAGAWIDRCGLGGCRALYPGSTHAMQELFDQLLDCAGMESRAAGEIGGRLLELILLRIRWDARALDGAVPDGRETFLRCRGFIQENYLELKSVAEVAERCHVDPAYLARLFKRFGDERPLQMINRLKTCHAADLILRRGCAVGAAGRAVGFADPYHFSRVFKRVHGVSPAQLRRLPGG